MFTNRQTGITTLALQDIDENSVTEQLNQAVGKAPKGFFTGLACVADLAQATADLDTLQRLKQQFLEHGLILIGISQHSIDAEVLLQAALADIKLPAPVDKNTEKNNTEKKQGKPPTTPTENSAPHSAQIIQQHIRSGQRIYAPQKDLIIIGSVGVGAEIIADGNIVIYGCLRGRAFAGAHGDQNTHIFCCEMFAELISIAGCYQTMEQLESRHGMENCLITLDSEERMTVRSIFLSSRHKEI